MKSFSDLEIGEKFSAVLYWSASLLWITDTAGPLADSYRGKILMDRVFVLCSEKGNHSHLLHVLELFNSG